jgi:CRISPR-associated exonuclease Cas4
MIHGVVDCFLETDTNIYPVEFKLESKKPTKGHILQLLAYSVCLSEMKNKKADKGFILFEKKGKVYAIDFVSEYMEELKKVIESIRENVSNMLMPASSVQISHCVQCEFLNHCNDRDI